jgi:hypothetical protein
MAEGIVTLGVDLMEGQSLSINFILKTGKTSSRYSVDVTSPESRDT